MNIAQLSYREIAMVIDVIDVPIFLLSVDGETIRFEKFNLCHDRTVGLNSAGHIGKTAGQIFPPRMAASLESNYWRCIEARAPYKYEELLQFSCGERWWETTLSPVFDEDGTITHIIGTSHDVTGYKTSIMDGVKELATASKRNEELHVFMTMAVHDLRPAIGNIKAVNDLVLREFEDLGDNKIKQIRLVSEIADAALETIERTLYFARMIGIEQTPQEHVDLNHCLSDIAALADPMGALKITYPKIEIECELVPIQMILRNLTENATRFANSRIDITVTESSDRPGQLVFRVSDDGHGFVGSKQEFAARLRSAGDQNSTTGFGLMAINQLVEQRGGVFWLGESRIAEGATLCFSLPGKICEQTTNQRITAFAS